LTKNTGATIEDLGYILLVQRFSARKALSSNYSIGNNRYILDDLGSALDTNLIA